MDEFDERQVLLRGKIAVQTVIVTVGMLLAAAFITDFGIYDIEKEIGFSDFMIIASCFIITFISVNSILRGAYFGLLSRDREKMIRYIFTALAMVEIGLSIFDIIRGESLSPVSIMSIIMMASISVCLWMKRKEVA
ncbi:NADH-quinone oxidoreductase [Amedibacillus hominis]|uniref:NADH-quinone oxidoreductase n=1 Tax=Amedibacillus hominis TaxID=2897776 RepID=A0ABS9RDC7_9FIRM|nr:NADH-quinone oxidoreductase [Amedibacillus hominis]MCH4286799.1 NADH-quinone oxidoreductase [Amedibacillus hominis]